MNKTTSGGGALNTPRSKGRMTEIETQVLSRLLKMLERSVKAGEDLDPFATAMYHGSRGGLAGGQEGTASPRKKKAGGKKAEKTKSRTAIEEGEDVVMDDANNNQGESQREQSHEMQEGDYDQLSKMLELARDSVLAADCRAVLLASDRLPKQVRACLSFYRISSAYLPV
jgi:cohesin loading factor subunit SCC2